MKSAVKSVSVTIAAGGMTMGIACTEPIPQGIIAANFEPASGTTSTGVGCESAGRFMWIPSSTSAPQCTHGCYGPETGNNANMTAAGTNDFQITQCSIVPQAGEYAVTINVRALLPQTVVVEGGPYFGTLTIKGIFPPRSRPGDGGAPDKDDVQIPNITMEYDFDAQSTPAVASMQLVQETCTAQYVYPDNGVASSNSLPVAADTYADSNGGRIWVSVFCDASTNLLDSTYPGNGGCAMSATFNFTNCSSQ